MCSSCSLHVCWVCVCVLARVVMSRDSGHDGMALFHECRYRCRCRYRSCCPSGKRNSSNETIAFNKTKKKKNRSKSQDRQSGHDPVLIVVVIIIIIVCKTNVVGRDSATIASASFLTHTCRWSFIAMVGVVVAVAFGEFVIVADSVVSLSSFC